MNGLGLNITLFQAIIAGLVSLATVLVTAVFAYRQATKVAERQGETTVAVKQLENEGAVHGYLHTDLTAAHLEQKELLAKHLACIEAKANAESEVRRLAAVNLQYETNNGVLKALVETIKHRADELETANRAWSFWLDRPDVLRQLAAAAEHRLQQNPQNGGLNQDPWPPLAPVPAVGAPALPTLPEVTPHVSQ